MARTQVPQNAAECNKARRELTIEQANAIDQLVTGATDEETAQAIGRNRSTIHRWRTLDPRFIAAMNARRQAVWGEAGDQLRALLARAVAVLKGEMEGEHRLAAAVHVLRLGGLGRLGRPEGEADGEALLEQLVAERNGRSDVSLWRPSAAQKDAYLAEIDRIAEDDCHSF